MTRITKIKTHKNNKNAILKKLCDTFLFLRSQSVRMKASLRQDLTRSDTQQTSKTFITSYKWMEDGNKSYSVGVIRERGQSTFRVILKHNGHVFVSEEHKFIAIKNPSMSLSDDQLDDFRRDILVALASCGDTPNYKVDIVLKKLNEADPNALDIVILKCIDNSRWKIGTITVYKGRGQKNYNYLEVKHQSTLSMQNRQSVDQRNEIKELQQNFDAAMRQIGELIASKDQREWELMHKFVKLLNAKKEKIRMLQREIQTLKSQKSTISPVQNRVQTQNVKSCTIQVDGESSENVQNSSNKKSLKRKRSSVDGDGGNESSISKISENKKRQSIPKGNPFSLSLSDCRSTESMNSMHSIDEPVSNDVIAAMLAEGSQQDQNTEMDTMSENEDIVGQSPMDLSVSDCLPADRERNVNQKDSAPKKMEVEESANTDSEIQFNSVVTNASGCSEQSKMLPDTQLIDTDTEPLTEDDLI